MAILRSSYIRQGQDINHHTNSLGLHQRFPTGEQDGNKVGREGLRVLADPLDVSVATHDKTFQSGNLINGGLFSKGFVPRKRVLEVFAAVGDEICFCLLSCVYFLNERRRRERKEREREERRERGRRERRREERESDERERRDETGKKSQSPSSFLGEFICLLTIQARSLSYSHFATNSPKQHTHSRSIPASQHNQWPPAARLRSPPHREPKIL